MPTDPRKPAFLSALSNEAATPAQFMDVTQGRRERLPSKEALAAAEAKQEASNARNLERVAMAVSLLRSQGERLAEQARSDALELAFLIARRILEREVSTDPGALMSLIRTAIAKAGETTQISIHLNPRDVETVRAAQTKDTGALALLKIDLVPDPNLGAGDCLVKTDLGTVDGRLATRLQEMREAIGADLGGNGT